MYGKVKKDVHEIIRTLCEYKKVKITAGTVCIDYVHLCIELPPKYTVSSFKGHLKRKSTLIVFGRHPEFKNRGDKEFLARGYCVEAIGNIDEATVREYIEKQIEESKKGNGLTPYRGSRVNLLTQPLFQGSQLSSPFRCGTSLYE